MKQAIFTYVVVDNDILRKGVEQVISTNFNTKVTSTLTSKELLSLNFNQKKQEQQFLIILAETDGNSTFLLQKLMERFPFLKVILIVKEFDYQKIRFYFKKGASCVVNRDISLEHFVNVCRKVLRGERCLAPDFSHFVIDSFCYFEKKAKVEENCYSRGKSIYGLTKREQEVLELICSGKNTKEISKLLFISPNTVETHRRNLLIKLDANNTAVMVKIAVQDQLIALEG